MTSSGEVSVVVPAFQAERWLAEAVESALGQTRPPAEILVVDDGSTDATAEVAGGFGHPVRVIRQENRGVAAARNRGLAEARGRWVAFLDADDAWEAGKLEAQVACLEADPARVAVHCAVTVVDAEGRPRVVRHGRGGDVLDELVTFREVVLVSGGSGLLAPRDGLRAVGGFHEALSTSADWDLYRRLAARGPLGYVDEPLVRYRVHGANMHQDLDRFEADMERAMARALADEPLRSAGPALRRRARGTLQRIFAGARFQHGQRGAAARRAAASLWQWPPGIGYFLAWPLRRLSGRTRDAAGTALARSPDAG